MDLAHGDVGPTSMENGFSCNGNSHGTYQIGIMAKELLLLVLRTVIWDSSLAGHKELYQCDNSSIIATICKCSARDTTVSIACGFLLPTMTLILHVHILQE